MTRNFLIARDFRHHRMEPKYSAPNSGRASTSTGSWSNTPSPSEAKRAAGHDSSLDRNSNSGLEVQSNLQFLQPQRRSSMHPPSSSPPRSPAPSSAVAKMGSSTPRAVRRWAIYSSSPTASPPSSPKCFHRSDPLTLRRHALGNVAPYTRTRTWDGLCEMEQYDSDCEREDFPDRYSTRTAPAEMRSQALSRSQSAPSPSPRTQETRATRALYLTVDPNFDASKDTQALLSPVFDSPMSYFPPFPGPPETSDHVDTDFMHTHDRDLPRSRHTGHSNRNFGTETYPPSERSSYSSLESVYTVSPPSSPLISPPSSPISPSFVPRPIAPYESDSQSGSEYSLEYTSGSEYEDEEDEEAVNQDWRTSIVEDGPDETGLDVLQVIHQLRQDFDYTQSENVDEMIRALSVETPRASIIPLSHPTQLPKFPLIPRHRESSKAPNSGFKPLSRVIQFERLASPAQHRAPKQAKRSKTLESTDVEEIWAHLFT